MMRQTLKPILFALLVLAVPAPAHAEAPLLDVDGRPIQAADASRIVSVGGAITEIVYRLGLQDRLVAVDTTSQYPPDALTDNPDVGYLRALSAEGVLSTRPTLIIADAAAGPPPVLGQLRGAGVRLAVLRDDPTPGGVVYKIRAIARLAGRDAAGERLAAAFSADMGRLQTAIGNVRQRPKVLFLLNVGRGAAMAAGQDTAADAVIRLAGARNAVQGYDGYRPLSPEAAISAQPDFVLVTERTADLMGGSEAILTRRELAATPAGRNGALIVMDGLYLLGFGPRTPQAVRELASALHPGLDLPPLETASAN